MLRIFSSPPFYSEQVYLPDENTPVPRRIFFNARFYPWFDGALGALDGTHLDAWMTADERTAGRDRNGNISQNVLAVCSFDLRFLYVLGGIEGSAADASIFTIARLVDFHVPKDRYYLGDAGFGSCDAVLVPYRGVRYHLAEWNRYGLA
jgi:hypothetical protein